jgi:hypothetical protein
MLVIRVISGLALLTLGRRLFWLFVGLIGFAVGIALAGQVFPSQSDLTQIIIALVLGILGALLAVTLQRIAMAAAGFLGSGYLAFMLFENLNIIQSDLVLFGLVLLGALIGASLIGKLFDTGLILLSSLIGAMLIIQSFEFPPTITLFGFVIISLIGILIQLNSNTKPNSHH